MPDEEQGSSGLSDKDRAVLERYLRLEQKRKDQGRPAPGPSRRSDAYGNQSRFGLSEDPAWERFPDPNTGRGTSPWNVLGAADIQGDAPINSAMRELVTDIGPYQAIGYDEDSMTTGEFYGADEGGAGHYLEGSDAGAPGFHEKWASGYRPEFNPEYGGVDAESLRGEDEESRLIVAYISSVGKWPADITLSPTSTTNPARPRTVAAGYDGFRKVLTTVFRDGTLYNYYGVDAGQWNNFVRARSKGRFIHTYLDGKVRGPAETTGMPAEHVEVLYRAARTAQVYSEGIQSIHKKGSKRGSGTGANRYGSTNTTDPKTGRAGRKLRAKVEKTFNP
jgi:hypothetical protein